ncbi:MAG: GerMN domain-containing protein, partial [Parcubacteria group bacterium]
TMKVFFLNTVHDPNLQDCSKVYSVDRVIAPTTAVARAALTELLKGPSATEKSAGYTTTINAGVKINSLTIENKIARVDFDEQLQFQVGGSCRVGAIISQITQTLKQFTTVDNVIISIDGRTEDILQP